MRARSTCLGDLLPEYVAGRLDPETRLHWDRHLVVCLPCQHAVADEQRLQAVLTHAVPVPPERLRTQLLALAAGDIGPTPGAMAVPAPAQPVPLLLVHPEAPPAHRSALRSAVVAVAVVGASAAAALTLSTNAPVRATTVTTAVTGPARSVPSTGSPSLGATLVEQAGLGTVTARTDRPARGTAGGTASPQAESTP